jgi:hypothetical protein
MFIALLPGNTIRERMEAMIKASQEKIKAEKKAAIQFSWSKLEKTISKWMEGILVSVDHWTERLLVGIPLETLPRRKLIKATKMSGRNKE